MLPVDAGVAVADVHRILEQALAVGADIEHHRDGPQRVDPARRRENRQLANRDLNAADAPIADPQNSRGVGRDDQVDFVGAGVEIFKSLLDGFGVVDREIDAPRTAELVVVLLHRHADGEVVDDGYHFPQMIGEQPVEQHFVAVVQGGQEDVLAQRVGQPLVLEVGVLRLVRQAC